MNDKLLQELLKKKEFDFIDSSPSYIPCLNDSYIFGQNEIHRGRMEP